MLDSDELAVLHKEVAVQFGRQRIVSISAAFAFAGLYIAADLYPATVTFSLMSIAASIMVVFVVWLIYDPEGWLRRYKALQLDLSSGIVHCFCTDGSVEFLEILPQSEIIFYSEKRPLKKWHRATITAVAKTPPISSIASEWLLPVDVSLGQFFSGKRDLSSAERDEIHRLAGQALEQRRRHALSYICWSILLVWLSRENNPCLFYVALAITAYMVSQIASEIRLCFALKKDASEGFVVISCRAKVEDGSMKQVGRPSEFLPGAQLKWTEGGDPAEWRKLPQR
jgi:hypothetical protein